MAKYGEPWQVGAYGTDQTRIYEDGLLLDSVCTMQLANSPGWKTRQARIVACVNALAEIENPEAIGEAIRTLKRVLRHLNKYCQNDAGLQMIDDVEAALAALDHETSTDRKEPE